MHTRALAASLPRIPLPRARIQNEGPTPKSRTLDIKA